MTMAAQMRRPEGLESIQQKRVEPMGTETKRLSEFFAAINRTDLQAATRHFDPQVVRVAPEGFPTLAPTAALRKCASSSRKGAGPGPKERTSPSSSC